MDSRLLKTFIPKNAVSHRCPLYDAIDQSKHSTLYIDFFTRNEIFTTLSHVSHYLRTYTANYRLALPIKKLELAADILDVKLDDTSTLPLHEKLHYLKTTLASPIIHALEEKLISDNIEQGRFATQPICLSTQLLTDLLTPIYLKHQFTQNLYAHLHQFSTRIHLYAVDKLRSPTGLSIREFIKFGADINFHSVNCTSNSLVLAINRNKPIAVEELLGHPELIPSLTDPSKITLNFSRLTLEAQTDYLTHAYSLVHKGASAELFLAMLASSDTPQHNWLSNNAANAPVIERFLEYCIATFKNLQSGYLLIKVLGKKNNAGRSIFHYLFQIDSNRIQKTLIALLNQLSQLGIKPTDLITLFYSPSDKRNSVLNPLAIQKSPFINTFYLSFLATLASADTIDQLADLFTQPFISNTDLNYSNYLDYFGADINTFLRRNMIEKFPAILKEKIHSLLPANTRTFTLPVEIPAKFIADVLSDMFGYYGKHLLFKSNLFFITLLKVFGISETIHFARMVENKNPILNNYYLFFPMTLSEKCIFTLVNNINDTYPNCATSLSTNDDYIPSLDDPDVNQYDFPVALRKDFLIHPQFLASMKNEYRKLLGSGEEKTQTLIDAQFKSAGCFPDARKLTAALQSLNAEFIANAANTKETIKLIALIQVFIDELKQSPRNNDFARLNQTIYSETSQARLIAKFGVIQPQRQLLEPIHEAAKQLTYRHPA